MTEFREYVIQPGTLISLGVFLFGLGATYIRIVGRIERNEERINDIEKEVADIDSESIKITLAQIQSDLNWIKMELSKQGKK